MSVSNGIITAPVSIEDVATCLGGGSYDLGKLCTSEKINKWSFYKPVVKNQIQEMSDNDFFSVDDGFTIPRFNSARAAWTAIVDSTAEWAYTKPSSYFRLTDFIKYNHAAEEWFNISLVGTGEVELGGSVSFNMNTEVDWLVNNFLTFKQYVSQSGGTLDFGFLLHDTSSSGDGVYYYKRCDTSDLQTDGKGLYIKFPSSTLDFNTGSYKVVPVLTTDTNHSVDSMYYPSKDEISHSWYVLPCTPIVINVSQGGSGDISNIDVEYISSVYEINGYFVAISSLILQFSNSSNSSLSPQYTVTLKDSVNQSVLKSDSVTIPAKNSVQVDLIGKNNTYNYESATGIISIEVSVRIGSTIKNWSFVVNSDKE